MLFFFGLFVIPTLFLSRIGGSTCFQILSHDHSSYSTFAHPLRCSLLVHFPHCFFHSATLVPHFTQNFAPDSNGTPQLEQISFLFSCWPQFGQNKLELGISILQLGHRNTPFNFLRSAFNSSISPDSVSISETSAE